MKFITVSELRLKATEVVREIEETKEEVIVTKKGKPVVIMRFIEHEAFSLKEKSKRKGTE
jgi:PHD/YefM family antitoxin component YafN of YafNO toxin-antitoxin module